MTPSLELSLPRERAAQPAPAPPAAPGTGILRLRARRRVADGTMAFHFERPPGFTFEAGQALELILPDPPRKDARGAQRALSIVSAPYEDELVVATRIRDSAFKRTLAELPPGATVGFDGPFGELVLHDDRTRPAIFIAGGIGITPFVSILRQALHDRLPQVMTLVYSNRRPEDAAFLDELVDLERRHRGQFRLIATMTGGAPSGQPWTGRSGPVDRVLLSSLVVRPVRPVFYLVGPPAMVAAMRGMLESIGARGDDVRSEDFPGY